MNSDEYKKYLNNKQPKSPIVKDVIWAFFIGGLICLIGETLYFIIEPHVDSVQIASTWVSIILIFLGGILTSFGIYDKIAKKAGAGTLVPITGFANAVISSAIEFKSEGFIAGLGGKIFSIAGPVIVYGVTSGIIVGILSLFIKI